MNEYVGANCWECLLRTVSPGPIATAALVLGGVLLTPGARVAGQEPSELELLEYQARQAETEGEALSDQADRLSNEAAELQRQLVALSKERMDVERELAALERDLALAEIRKATLEQQLATDRIKLEDALAALARLARANPPTLAVTPADAAHAARAALALEDVTRHLRARIAQSSAQIVELKNLGEHMIDQRQLLNDTQLTLLEQRDQILSVLNEKRRLEDQLRQDAGAQTEQAEHLNQEIETLGAAIELAERESVAYGAVEALNTVQAPIERPEPTIESPSEVTSRPPQNAQPFDNVVSAPVVGEIIRTFGEDRPGRPSTGIVYGISSRAQIVAVADSVVAFSGLLRGYGRILILELGPGYYVVLAGLGEVYVQKGQGVLAGEPIGEAPAIGDAMQELYVEFRKRNTPIDPYDWLIDERSPAVVEKPA